MIKAEDRRKLIRFLGMLGSEHDGEVVNAARIALRLIKDRGFTWDDLLAPAAPDIQPPPARPRGRPQTPRPQPQPRSVGNPYQYLAADLMNEFMKRRRVAAVDLSLVNSMMDPFHVPSTDQQRRFAELYKAAFGKDCGQWSKAS